MRVDLAGLELRNPVMLAAGTAGHLDELADVIDLSTVGAVVTKSITPEPREGHGAWRVLDSRVGMLNAVGLANVGIEAFKQHHLPRVREVPSAVVVSIAGFRVEDYVYVASELDGHVDAVECNVSCPNVDGGTEFGSEPDLLRDLIGQVRAALPRTRLFVKLSPVAFSPPGIVGLAQAAVAGHGVRCGPNDATGADALSISNTMPAMEIDVETRRPRLRNVMGGLSGPAIHPVVTRLIHLVRGRVEVPIIGVGGVLRWQDAAEFVLAGASAVQIGTGTFADPRIPGRVSKGLSSWVRRQGVSDLSDLVGALEPPSEVT